MYEIPKIAVPVEILLVSNESIEGKLFVTEDLVSAGGNPEVTEFLNTDEDSFFPFESNAGAYRLINKHHVVYIRTEQDDSEVKKQTPIPPRNMVAHFTNDRTVYGLVYPTMAEESRVSDIINQHQTFLTIYQNGQKLIVNRHHVIYVNAN